MQEIIIKVVEVKGYNVFLAVDKNNNKYLIDNNKLLEIGKYYKIDLMTERRSIGVLGTKVKHTISNIREMEIVNGKLYLKGKTDTLQGSPA